MITKNASLSLCFDGCCFLLLHNFCLLSYNRRFVLSFFAARAISRDVDDPWRTHKHSVVVSQIEKQYYLAGLKMSMCER